MIRYILKRLLMLIPVMIGVSLFIFIIMDFAPGDAAMTALGDNAPSSRCLNTARNGDLMIRCSFAMHDTCWV